MNFSPNKTPIEIIKEGAFGSSYFRDIYSNINKKWYKNSWKEFFQLKDIDAKFYASDYYDVNVNKYDVKCGTSSRFCESKGCINKIDPYGWFQWCFRYWLGRRSKHDKRQINRCKKIASRFRGKLVKMIRNAGSKYDDFSISPKIRQILLHWGYELTKKDFFNELSNQCIKMNYYWFNRQEILQKAKEKYSKEKAPEYYKQNKEAIKKS